MWIAAVILVGGAAAAQAVQPDPSTLLQRAVASFAAGRLTESAQEFDELARLRPGDAPHLWQRGIALYYAGRYRECRAQFESHRTVNPADVENAAWHFLCVARGESVDAARSALLPVGADPRVPMREIYQMFRGVLEPDRVMTAAGSRPEGQFYGHLYVGLYLEAVGNKGGALGHLQAAADRRFAAVGGYMHMVAGVHLSVLQGSR
jgi:lipoprotein NlpI